MTTALEKIEATISEIDGPAKADYRELVHRLVLRPNDMPDVKRVRKILDACGKSLDDLKADVLKLANCHEVELRIAEAEKAMEKIPELKSQAAAAEQRVLKAKEKLLPIITEGADEMKSVRFTALAPNDWKSIDLFASDDEPRIGSGRHVGVPQYRETAIGRPVENAEISGVRPRSSEASPRAKRNGRAENPAQRESNGSH
jgi:hypothetical protein